MLLLLLHSMMSNQISTSWINAGQYLAYSKAKGGDPMPGFNRRGPEGMGPMTGGGRGLCNPANRILSNQEESFTGNAGRGRGRGAGRKKSDMGRRAGFGNAGFSNFNKNR